ncbi:MAG: phosphatidylglycerophosphatase [Clostridiales bacterium]|jgi:phosphatidylglycerophosphatase A|nr:phosphatidylglycerophosphatase [Clostridiales bacterium]MDN5281153.1 phosphatidylglycerophosphatase [Candidatus Ozemobacter sp.]
MTISKRIGTSWTSSSKGSGLLKFLGSCCWLGYLPKAPGTFGSIAGIALFLLTRNYNQLVQTGILFVFILSAIGISERLEKVLRTKDPQEVVIDEAAGMWLALIFIWDASSAVIVTGFILFRLFDILKPFPISLFQTFRGGVGILADDIAAGMLTNLILRILIIKGIL